MLNAPSEIASTAPTAQRNAPRQDRAAPTDSFASLVDSNTADAASSQPASTPDTRTPSRADDRAARPNRSDSTDQSRPRDRSNDNSAPPNRTDASQTNSSSTTKPGDDSKTAKSGDSKPADATKSSDSKDDTDTKTADQSQSADSNAATQPVIQAAIVATVVPTTPTGAAGVPTEGTTDATAGSGPLTIAAAAALKAQATIADLAPTGQPAETGTAATATAATATGVTTDPKLALLAAQPNTGKTVETKAETNPAATIKTPATTEATPAAGAPHGQAQADAAKPQGDQAGTTAATGNAVDQLDVQAKPAAHQHHADAAAQAAPDPSALQPQVQPAQPLQASTLTQQTAAAPQLTAALATNVPVAVQDLAVTIAARANGGASRFEIRLDPAELGRIDVRIDVDRHGQVTSHLTVEKPETLAMLRQDQTQLQRALDNAGLKTGDSGLQFSLRDQSSSGQQGQQQQDGGRHAQRLVIKDEDLPPAMTAGRSYGRMLGASSGVDIRI
ncbi:flagellar hook-length control protein FliK [Rhodopseudomonas telluris]|uniref:flagellar hook-length control protein FliK n=1 Tax=Rhodopseudomonas telluris TaxID=644215 RepID=UPI00406BA985